MEPRPDTTQWGFCKVLKQIYYTKTNYIPKYSYVILKLSKMSFPYQLLFRRHLLPLKILQLQIAVDVQRFKPLSETDWPPLHFFFLCHFEVSSPVFNRALGFLYFTVIGVDTSSRPLVTVRMPHPLCPCSPHALTCSAIVRCGSGRCEGLSWFLSSSLLSSSASPPPSGSSGKPRQCEAPEADERDGFKEAVWEIVLY